MGRYKTLVANTFIFGICSFTSKLLVFFMLPFYTAVLSKEEFGTADYVSTIVGLLVPVISLSISHGCMRYALDKNEDPKQTFSFGIRVLTPGVIFLICCSPFLLMISVIKDYVLLFILLYTSQVFQRFFSLFARGLNNVSLVGVAGVASSFVVVISNIILLFIFHFGVKGFLFSMIVSDLTTIIILFFGCHMYKFFVWKVDVRLSKEILSYSIPMIPNSLGWWINHSVNRLILNHYCGVAEVGVYSASAKMPTIIDTFRGFFVQAWQLSTIMEYDKDDSDSFFERIYRIYNVLIIVLCTLLVVFSKSIAFILYSKDFFDAWRYTPVLIASVLFGSLIAYFSPSYLAHKHTKKIFLSTMLGAFVTIVFNFLLIPSIGVMGAALTSLLSNIAVFSYVSFDCKKYYSFNIFRIRHISSYIIVTVFAVTVGWYKIDPISIWSVIMFIVIFIINRRDIIDLINDITKIVKWKLSH